MKRRDFITTSALAATTSVTMSAAASEHESSRQFLELREYETLVGSRKNEFHDFLRHAAIPAWKRLGIKRVGVFTVRYGMSAPSLYVLLPHPSMESVLTSTHKMLEDDEFLKTGEEVVNAPLSNPSYVRYESALMAAFEGMPQVEVPESIEGKGSRVFELRIYESHSEKAAKKKIEMFNEGGEIAIFRKTGLNPIFFGESLIGPNLPNLTYMLGFENMEARDKAWSDFVSHPDWKELSQVEEYKDTVSNISDIILRPTGYSQI